MAAWFVVIEYDLEAAREAVRANKLRDDPIPPADVPLIPHLIDLLM